MWNITYNKTIHAFANATEKGAPVTGLALEKESCWGIETQNRQIARCDRIRYQGVRWEA